VKQVSGFKDAGFAERQKTAARAKQVHLEKFRSMPANDDPRIVEMRAARQVVSAAREARAVERKAAREAQLKSDALAQQAALAEQAERDAAEKTAKAEREAAEVAERKSARDARYAARKARR
jgi:Family of unknown function (DUF6481)